VLDFSFKLDDDFDDYESDISLYEESDEERIIVCQENFFLEGHICPYRILPTMDICVLSAAKGLKYNDTNKIVKFVIISTLKLNVCLLPSRIFITERMHVDVIYFMTSYIFRRA
jgi:hypothetical protein